MTITIRDNSYNRLVGMDDPVLTFWKSDSKSWMNLIGQELEIVSKPKIVEIYINGCGTHTYQMIQAKGLDKVLRWVLYASLKKDDTWSYLYPEAKDQSEEKSETTQIKIIL